MKAIIDLGTNTFNLLIAGLSGNTIHTAHREEVPVKLGQGISDGMITQSSWIRAIQTLSAFHSVISANNVSEVICAGTSALRNARNGNEFIKEVKEKFGFNILTISGSKEAELIYRGVEFSFTFPDEPVWVMDIGGGSVEFILGRKHKILWKHSFEIGATRLLQRFGPNDPIIKPEISQIRHYLNNELTPLIEMASEYKAETLIGASGSFESLEDVLIKSFGKTAIPITPYATQIHLEDFHHFCSQILKSDSAARKSMRGLVDFRIETIPIATLLMETAVSLLNIQKLIVSRYALKEGLLAKSGATTEQNDTN